MQIESRVETTDEFILWLPGSIWYVFKQQFLIFLEIHVGEKIYENTCNIV